MGVPGTGAAPPGQMVRKANWKTSIDKGYESVEVRRRCVAARIWTLQDEAYGYSYSIFQYPVVGTECDRKPLWQSEFWVQDNKDGSDLGIYDTLREAKMRCRAVLAWREYGPA